MTVWELDEYYIFFSQNSTNIISYVVRKIKLSQYSLIQLSITPKILYTAFVLGMYMAAMTWLKFDNKFQ